MAGSTLSEAFHNFLDPLKRAVSCVTPGQIKHEGWPQDRDRRLALEETLPRGEHMRLSILQTYRLVKAEGERGPLKATTRAYAYILENADGRELVAFHWHPGGRSSVERPHMHLGAGCGVDGPLTKVHFPTGRVSVEDFLWLAIHGFGAEPQRDDWEDVLTQSRDAFQTWRTWA